MRFAYYRKLTAKQRAIYRASDAVAQVKLDDRHTLRMLVAPVIAALAKDDQRETLRRTRAFVSAFCKALGVPRVDVRVLARRPSDEVEELHGYYEREEGRRAVIRVWMRTAAHARPVAPRTFLRTLLHELCHHLDYEHLALADSFHTVGFFKRESHLCRQLLPRPVRPGRRAPTSAGAKATRASPAERTASADTALPVQLSLLEE